MSRKIKPHKGSERFVPDLQNSGTMLRVMLILALVRLVWLAGQERLGSPFWSDGIFELSALITICLAYLTSTVTRRLSSPSRWIALAAVGVFTPLVPGTLLAPLLAATNTTPWWFTMLASASLLLLVSLYLHWRHLRLSPVLTEARLMALRSRIQPHFLFNSLNSAITLVRLDPGKAESVLQDLSELFRAVLSDSRQLVPLADELRLAKAYIDIETTRLGNERLKVQWLEQHAPLTARVPALLLQPLLENAIRHSVELNKNATTVTVEIYRDGTQVRLFVRNPIYGKGAESRGHQMALDNLRERLALHFDQEASLKVSAGNDEFIVQVLMPLN